MLAHSAVSLLYFFIILARQNKSQAVSEGLIVFCIPVFGLIFLLGVRVAELWRFRREDPSYMYSEFKNSRPVLGGIVRREANIIPIQDALFLKDVKMKRALLTDAIKQNVLSNNNLLFKAVRDEDREVSHYAVSAVTNIIEKLEALLFRLEKRLRETPGDVGDLKKYADAMDSYLRIGFLDAISQQKGEKNYAAILETLLSLDTTEKKYFIKKINCEIKLNHYEKAEEFCAAFLKHFPGDEEPYILYIKLYRQMEDYPRLQEKVRQLKASPIKLTINALETIRFWDGGGQYV